MNKFLRLVGSIASALGLPRASSPRVSNGPGSPTMELRQRTLDLRPDDIKISQSSYPHAVWGLVMDTAFDDGDYYSFIALADGTTSVYFSNGGGIVGAGRHAQVRSALLALLESADSYVSFAQQAASTPLPTPGLVSLHLHTFGGLCSYTASEQDLGNGSDKMSPLFLRIHHVIGLVRQQ